MPSNSKEYQKQYIRTHYEANKEYYKQKARERKVKISPIRRAILSRYKLMKGCVDCGYKENPYALDFDHVRGVKSFNISSSIISCGSWKKIKEEVFKCEVRCANCHRIKTFST